MFVGISFANVVLVDMTVEGGENALEGYSIVLARQRRSVRLIV